MLNLFFLNLNIIISRGILYIIVGKILGIFSDGAISHTVNVPLAGEHVTNDIARAIGTSIQNAEDIKKKHSK